MSPEAARPLYANALTLAQRQLEAEVEERVGRGALERVDALSPQERRGLAALKVRGCGGLAAHKVRGCGGLAALKVRGCGGLAALKVRGCGVCVGRGGEVMWQQGGGG